jgi:hypothetical protein
LAYNEQYYKEKKDKLLQRKQIVLQKYVSSAFDFTQDMVYLDEQLKELESSKIESEQQSKPKK